MVPPSGNGVSGVFEAVGNSTGVGGKLVGEGGSVGAGVTSEVGIWTGVQALRKSKRTGIKSRRLNRLGRKERGANSGRWREMVVPCLRLVIKSATWHNVALHCSTSGTERQIQTLVDPWLLPVLASFSTCSIITKHQPAERLHHLAGLFFVTRRICGTIAVEQAQEKTMVKQVKIIVEKHPDGYVAYPLGLKGVVVGEGDTYEEALADVKSAIQFHIETFGKEYGLIKPD
jgi:predicted RNase H-like HicB family nuclease